MLSTTLIKLRNSLRLRKPAPVAATWPFVDANAATVELECAPELPPVAGKMVRREGQRLRALRYEGEFYSRF